MMKYHLLILISVMVLVSACKTRPAQNPSDSFTEAADSVRTLFFLRDHEGATDLGNRLLQENRRDYALKAWTIVANSHAGNEDEALAQAESLMEERPEDPWSWFALAGATTWHGETDDRALEVSAEMEPRGHGHPDFLWMRGYALRYHDQDEGQIYFDSLLALGHDEPEFRNLYASFLNTTSWQGGARNQERADSALMVLEEVRTDHPENFGATYLAGSYLSSSGRSEEALTHLRRAAEMSPDATTLHYSYWRAVMSNPTRSTEEKRAEIEVDMARMEARRPESGVTLFRIAGGYDLLGDKEKKEAYYDRVLEVDPEGNWAEWVQVERYRNYSQELGQEGWKDPEKLQIYAAMLREFLNRETISQERLRGDAYRSLFYVVTSDSMDANAEELFEAVDGMVKYEGINYHITHARGPIALVEEGVHFDYALETAQAGIDLMRERIEEQNESGIYETEGEFAQAVDSYSSIGVDAVGWIHFKAGRLQEAETELLRAHELNPKNVDNLHHLGQFYLEAYRRTNVGGDLADLPNPGRDFLDLAEGYHLQGSAIQRPGTNPNDEALKEVFEFRNGTLDGFDEYLARAEELDRERRRSVILEEGLEEPFAMPDFELVDLDQQTWTEADLVGKIVVLNYWGTWCGPCIAEMPDIQKLHDQYKDDPNVVVVTLSNDVGPEVVRQYMEENGFSFPVLMDDGYVSRNSINAFPTTWFVDAADLVRYSKRGWSGELVEEFNWRIEDIMMRP